MYKRLATRKRLGLTKTEKKGFLPSIKTEDCLKNLAAAADPFSMNEITVNLRSGYQMASHFSLLHLRGTEFRA